MDNGFILLSRNLLESDVFASQKLLKIWIWCLLKANYKDKTCPLKVGKGEINGEQIRRVIWIQVFGSIKMIKKVIKPVLRPEQERIIGVVVIPEHLCHDSMINY